MINYIYSKGSQLIKFNDETKEINTVDNTSANIDWLWIVNESGVINGNEVNPGDIIIALYGIGETRDREVFVIKDAALIDYYKRLCDYYEKRRKEREELGNCIVQAKSTAVPEPEISYEAI